ncbi:ABC transporter permease [Actinomadura darangshiensis]|uniref:ABC transporter permease n=1 Tax=Actinomadura darangshiensis TaxID=705336 RepID=A0A4R5BA27_9ACTN|nr:FtsX-like permease family protein [Actinomadura darangshiensis]TDD80564.1 ABC transporter permease [Actinomadura darangshiensis]
MGRRGLVLSRMAGDRTLMLAACAIALFATTVLAALAGYTGSVTREGLRRTLAEATFESTGTTIGVHVPARRLTQVRGQVDRSLRQIFRDLPRKVSMSARSDTYTLPGQENGDHPDLTVFGTWTGIDRHARLAGGRWPRAADGEVEAALPVTAAHFVHAAVGDVLTLHGRVDKKSVARVRVVGLFEVPDPDGYFWQDDRLITAGVERLGYTTYGPFVVPPEVFAERFTGTGVEARFTVLPDLRRLDVADLAGLRDRTAAAGDILARSGGGGTQFTVVTELAELARRLNDAVLVARSTMLIPVIQLVLLAGFAWLLVARLLADHRRAEIALLRTRGIGVRQLVRLGLAEGLLVVLPAAVLGPLLARPLLRLAGQAPAVRASGLRLDTGAPEPLWAVSAAVALACAVALTVPALRGLGRTFVEVETGLGRPPRGGARGSGIDLALLLVAGLALWRLGRYGATGPRAAAGVDPFIVSGPALALLAGGVLMLRLLPAASRLAERAATRGSGLVPVLGTRQVGRRPLRYAGPVLLLAMAMAVGVLSVTTMATWRRSQTDQADFQSGADLRLVRSDSAEGPGPLGQGERFATLPGVMATSAVLRLDTRVGEGTATVLAVDAEALRPILRVQDGLRRDLRLGELAKARPAVPALAVPGRPRRLRFDVRLRRDGPVPDPLRWKASPATDPFRIAVTLMDARGAAQRVTLPEVAADGDEHSLTVDVAGLAGPGGLLAYPLSVRGIDYAYDFNPVAGPLVLDVLRVHGEDGDAAPPAGTRWDGFGRSPDAQTLISPDAGAVRDGLLRLGIPASPFHGTYDGPALPIARAYAHAMAAGPSPPAHSAANAGLLPAVPGVITSAMAGRAGTGVGGTVTVDTAAGDQPIKVVGVAPALPTVPAGEPGALVDLPTLTERRLAATGADPVTVAPGEWWTSVRGGRAGPAVRALAAHPGWGRAETDRAALRTRLRDAPLGAGLQGALVLGFGTGLAFAVIAFVVNAAVTAGERSREFGVLRVLGVRPRQVLGMLAIEQAYLVVLGLLGGTALGLVVARLAVPHIVLGVRAARPYPPVAAVFPWPVLLGMIAGVTAVLGLVLPPVIAALRRRNLAAGLRVGQDQ